MSIVVPLRSGRDESVVGSTVIDDVDADWVFGWTWRLSRTGDGYAVRYETGDGRRTVVVSLAREILGLPRVGREPQADHINGNTMDNRRANLRRASCLENSRNQIGHAARTGLPRGVTRQQYRSGTVRYMARARIGDQTFYLGSFEQPEEAGAVVRAWRLEHMPGDLGR